MQTRQPPQRSQCSGAHAAPTQNEQSLRKGSFFFQIQLYPSAVSVTPRGLLLFLLVTTVVLD